MPIVEGEIACLLGQSCYITVDLTSGYYQAPMGKKCERVYTHDFRVGQCAGTSAQDQYPTLNISKCEFLHLSIILSSTAIFFN